jgi:hypothetical protein
MNEQTITTPVAESVSRALNDIARSLCTSTDIAAVADPQLSATYATGLAWIQRFIMQAHPNLGRKGAVCPFAKPSHEERALVFCAFDAAEMSFDSYIDTLMRMPRFFDRLAKERREPSDLLSLAIFPQGLGADGYYKFIDCAHTILKPFYMECGLMLGEFHPASTVRGAHSATFRPMRADVPLFVIRAMALHDILFIDGESTSLGMRVHELDCYLRWNAQRLSASEAEAIEARLAQRKAQLVDDVVAAV